MFQVFLDNLILIGCLYLILGVSVLADVFAGIQLNVNTLGLRFSKKKLFGGLNKAIQVAIILFLLIIPITFIPFILDMAKVELPKSISDYVSIYLIFGLLLSASVKYFKEAFKKLTKILNITEEEKIALVQKVVSKIELPEPKEPTTPVDQPEEDATEIVRN
jgi:hypothetical protein